MSNQKYIRVETGVDHTSLLTLLTALKATCRLKTYYSRLKSIVPTLRVAAETVTKEGSPVIYYEVNFNGIQFMQAVTDAGVPPQVVRFADTILEQERQKKGTTRKKSARAGTKTDTGGLE